MGFNISKPFEIKKLLKIAEFPVFENISDRSIIADLYRPGKRTGIYILHFKNNDYYIGQAIDVVKRFLQHSKTHDDIENISFKRFSIKLLNTTEKKIISLFESRGVKLRNISLTSIPKGDSDFDILIPLDLQVKWIKGIKIKFNNTRRIDEVQRRKYEKKFLLMSVDKNFGLNILKVYKKYVSECIINPELTEFFYWSVSCLPLDNSRDRIYSLLSIYWQEVFQMWVDKKTGINYFQVRLAKSPFSSRENLIKDLKKTIPSIRYDDNSFYETGGTDQFCSWVVGTKDIMVLLKNKDIIKAIRLLNIRLMKKGVCVPRRFHCYDLATTLLSK